MGTLAAQGQEDEMKKLCRIMIGCNFQQFEAAYFLLIEANGGRKMVGAKFETENIHTM